MLDERRLIAKAIRATSKIEAFLEDPTTGTISASDLSWIRMQLTLDAYRYISVPRPPPITEEITNLMNEEFETGSRPPQLADWLQLDRASSDDELRTLADALDRASDAEA